MNHNLTDSQQALLYAICTPESDPSPFVVVVGNEPPWFEWWDLIILRDAGWLTFSYDGEDARYGSRHAVKVTPYGYEQAILALSPEVSATATDGQPPAKKGEDHSPDPKITKTDLITLAQYYTKDRCLTAVEIEGQELRIEGRELANSDYSEKTIRRSTKRLESRGLLKDEGHKHGKSITNEGRMMVEKLKPQLIEMAEITK